MIKLEHAFASLNRQITKLWRSMEVPPEVDQLSFSEYDYLKSIQFLKTPKLSEIATDMAVKKPSATAMIKRLEEKQLVRRSPCPDDGRATRITLTEKGHELLSHDDVLFANLAQEFREKLGAEDVREFQRLMSIIFE